MMDLLLEIKSTKTKQEAVTLAEKFLNEQINNLSSLSEYKPKHKLPKVIELDNMKFGKRAIV